MTHVWGVSKAADRVWAQVSGLPRAEGANRLLMTYQIFLDDSGDDQVFVLAGYVSTVDRWAALSEQWENALHGSSRYRELKRFKMKEMTAQLERVEGFYRIIEQHVTAAVSYEIEVPVLVEVVRNFNWPAYFGNREILENPYFMAFRSMIRGLAYHHEKLSIEPPVDFYCDDQTEKKRIYEVWDTVKWNLTPGGQAFIRGDPRFEKDEDFKPLQAADLYAWWVRKWRREPIRRTQGEAPYHFPWEIKRKIPTLKLIDDKAHLIRNFENMSTMPLTIIPPR